MDELDKTTEIVPRNIKILFLDNILHSLKDLDLYNDVPPNILE